MPAQAIKRCKTPGCPTTGYDNFYRHPMMADGHLSFCKPCIRRQVTNRRDANPELHAARDRQRYQTQPQRREQFRHRPRLPREVRQAHGRVRRAVLRGDMTRPSTCEQCRTEGYIEAAHYDYAQPLLVRWLCRRCHRKWDAVNPKSK